MKDLLDVLERPSPAAAERLRQEIGRLLEELVRAFACDRGLVAGYDPQAQRLRGAFGLNISAALVQAMDLPLMPGGLIDRTIRSRTPGRVDDVHHDERLRPETRQVLAEAGFDRCIFLAVVRDGAVPAVIVLGRANPFTDEELRVLQLATSYADDAVSTTAAPTYRSAAEQAAIEKEWLWSMLGATEDPVILTDARNEIVLRNSRAEELFQARGDDSAGKRHAIQMNNFLFTAALSAWTLDPSRREGREVTLVDPIEGEDLIFEVITVPARNVRSGERGTVSVLKDVTGIRQVTEELHQTLQQVRSAGAESRAERDRLDLILQSVPNPIIVIDNENQPIIMNPAARRIFAIPRGPTAGDRSAVIGVANEAKFTSFLAGLRLDPTGGRVGELALTDPDSEELLEIAVTAQEVRDPHGAVAGVVAVLQDIGRLRELERRRVEQILFETEKLAATGRLAASIAHEINNPLEAIQNALYLLVQGLAEGDPNRKFLEIARKETSRMSRILRELLGFYRRELSFEQTDVNGLIEDALTLITKRIRERRVVVESRLGPRLPRVRASADQLKQVVLNLLLNAAEAIPDGGVITVTTLAEPEPARGRGKGTLQIQVRDTGMGIPEENMGRLFEPFFSTKSGKGSGLGLWVSHGIVQAHGGTMQVRSIVGRGTTFTVTLPVGGPGEHTSAVAP